MAATSRLESSDYGGMMQPIISLHNVTKVFRESAHEQVIAVEDISLEITQGEFFIFLGPSGSGKSTLLRIMSGLEKSYEGTVTLASDIGRANTSFVFQQFALWPWLTVSQNIGIGLLAQHADTNLVKSRVERELIRFGLTKFAHSYPRELSGGMRQRVGIARALATDPKIIFMDEPFSELDSFTAALLRKEILAVWAQSHPTVIMVTHLIEEAIELSDRIAVLTSRPGKIEKIVDNTIPRPRKKRSKEFFALEDKLYKLVSP
jgi:NitT/TauT family transport system ATP-binding protein